MEIITKGSLHVIDFVSFILRLTGKEMRTGYWEEERKALLCRLCNDVIVISRPIILEMDKTRLAGEG
jgi:hypothetical protein